MFPLCMNPRSPYLGIQAIDSLTAIMLACDDDQDYGNDSLNLLLVNSREEFIGIFVNATELITAFELIYNGPSHSIIVNTNRKVHQVVANRPTLVRYVRLETSDRNDLTITIVDPLFNNGVPKTAKTTIRTMAALLAGLAEARDTIRGLAYVKED